MSITIIFHSQSIQVGFVSTGMTGFKSGYTELLLLLCLNLSCSTIFYMDMCSLHMVLILMHISKERSGSVVECLTRDRSAAGSGPWARHIYLRLILVQTWEIHPYITERLLMGRKESNQTNKQRSFWQKEIKFCIIKCVSVAAYPVWRV